MTTRRSFLTACLATFSAPMIVRASSLMESSVRSPLVLHPDAFSLEIWPGVVVSDCLEREMAYNRALMELWRNTALPMTALPY